MQPKSNNLFHFTKSLEFLKEILQTGFLPRYSLEDASVLKDDYIGYPMVCFCDIPISRISEHTTFYGEYGLGMTKDWGLKNLLAPIIYTPPSSIISELTTFLLNYNIPPGNHDSELHDLADKLQERFFLLIPRIKPLSGNMLVGGKVVEKDFLQENEWRYVPPYDEILTINNFEKEKDAYNKKMEKHRLTFTPTDVKYIFVKNDFEIPEVFDYIQTNLEHFPLADLKILISRIVSLETISRDL